MWKHVVLDTSAFIQGEIEQLRAISENLWTLDEVLNEVRDQSAKKHLDFAFLISNVQIRRPKLSSIEFVSQFARNTGDFASLSKTDLLVLALCFELGKETGHVVPSAQEILKGQDEEDEDDNKDDKQEVRLPSRLVDAGKSWAAVLNSNPTPAPPPPTVPGPQWTEDDFQVKDKVEETNTMSEEWPSLRPNTSARVVRVPPPPPQVSNTTSTRSVHDVTKEKEEEEEEDKNDTTPPPVLMNQSRILSLNPGVVSSHKDDEDDNEADWAKPGSCHSGWGKAASEPPKKPAAVAAAALNNVTVACASADFAVQNILLQMNLGLVSLDGRRITQVKSWVLKCDGCLRICTKQSKLFCPSCGQSGTLARLAFSIGADGKRSYHYAKNRRIKTRGNRYPIPANADLLLREDQLLSGRWAQAAMTKVNSESLFGRDVNDAMNVSLKHASKLEVGFGSQNPNSRKGRERRGAKKRG